MAETWRLIIEPQPRRASVNMAMDEALAESVASGCAPPTLRLYRWSPAAVSIGRFQSVADLDLERLDLGGLDWVRRLSGGRALLHGNELTYALLLPLAHPVAQLGILDSYRALAGSLRAALATLGVNADPLKARARRMAAVSAACLEQVGSWELAVAGRKLVGSAQCRRHGYVLQHGSLPLDGDPAALAEVLCLDTGGRERLRNSLRATATTLAREVDKPGVEGELPDWQPLARAFACGFGNHAQVDWTEDGSRPAELEAAARLARVRYAAGDWLNLR
ncbi:MAG: lipoate--protein ligase family protein [Caldilineaceae bacterium]|nr:lipoate--protein ligase family protein [Caldilineaceae bacterium]